MQIVGVTGLLKKLSMQLQPHLIAVETYLMLEVVTICVRPIIMFDLVSFATQHGIG